MKLCEACGRDFQDDVVFCPIDGHPLIDKPEARKDTAALTDPLVGSVLDEKYRLDKKIGEGGMGAVYRGTHVHMDSNVAVKLLHKAMVADSQAVERFRREARAAARIRHANAVSVTDFGVTKDGTVYLVMEYLEGQDLREKLRQVKRMQPEETVRIMMQTCAAIEEAHRKGIVHRDLKPDNIWLLKREGSVEDEQVKVLDFGIAKLKTQAGQASNLTQQGMIVGTPHYMSPEQCRGEELDARSDLYSLGAVLYEMLSGDVPFRAPTPVAVVLKHANELPRPLRQVAPDVPEALEAVVMRALEKSRDARQKSAQQMSAELVEALRVSGYSTANLISGTNVLPSGSFPPMPGQNQAATGQSQAATGQNQTYSPSSSRTNDLHGGTSVIGRGGRTTAVTGPAHAQTTDGTQMMSSGQIVSSGLTPTVATADQRPGATAISPMPAVSHTKMFAALGAIAAAALTVMIWVAVTKKPVESPANANATTNTAATTGGGAPASKIPDEMVLVKGAAFKMGAGDDSPKNFDGPEHEVTVGDFLIDKYEVTNEDYQRFVKETKRQAPKHWSGNDFPPGQAKVPVVNVTWFDAKDYAAWAGKRLPTEAEWEFAARGVDGRMYPWGADWTPQLSNSSEDQKGAPVPVGSYPRGISQAGCYDMAGNVAEWVSDDYAPYPGSKVKSDPGFKCYRGGAYQSNKDYMKTTVRWWDQADKPLEVLGFRCAKDAPK